MNKFCSQCGATVDEAQRFCKKCGAQMVPTQPAAQMPPGTYQSSYQSSVQPPGGAAPYQPPAPYQPGGYDQAPGGAGLTANLAAALCYLFVPAIILLVLDPYNKNRFIRFHAWQAIFFFFAWIVLSIGLGIVGFVIPNFIEWIIWLAFRLGFFVGWIALMVQAYQNQMYKLPVIGDIAEQQAR